MICFTPPPPPGRKNKNSFETSGGPRIYNTSALWLRRSYDIVLYIIYYYILYTTAMKSNSAENLDGNARINAISPFR